jgi:glycosyltransferase involved in cell wall biosynthesis
MRIAVMLRTLDERGGIGVYTRNLVDTMLSIDSTNEYLLLYRNPENVGRYADRPNVRERVVHGWHKAVWDQISVPLALRRERPDVVLHPKFTVPLLSSVPSLMVLHGADWWLPEAAHFYTRLDRLYMHVFMPLYLRRAAAVLSVSQLTTDHFNRIFGLPPGKVRTTLFAPARHFRRVEDAATLHRVKERYRLPDRFVLTLSKGGGGDRKNIAGVFRAFERIRATVSTALVVVGQGCERFREEYGVPSSGWGADVHFPGWIDQADLPAVYTLGELLLYPSHMEAFPIPITEAMACGKAIVTSAVNGPREIAGDAALLVDPADPAAIADAVRLVMTDPTVRARLEAAALERSRLYSWDRCASLTLEALDQISRRRQTTEPAGARIRYGWTRRGGDG